MTQVSKAKPKAVPVIDHEKISEIKSILEKPVVPQKQNATSIKAMVPKEVEKEKATAISNKTLSHQNLQQTKMNKTETV